MPSSTYFVQGCPTCGRRLHIRVEHLGRKVVCPHCRGTLTACDPSSQRDDAALAPDALLRRADELLDHFAEQVVARHPERVL